MSEKKIEIRLLKEKERPSAPSPLRTSTRLKFIFLLVGLTVACGTFLYATYLQREIDQMRHPEVETLIKYVTVTPPRENINAFPTAVLLPTPNKETAVAPVETIGPIFAFGDKLFLIANKATTTELWRTTGANASLYQVADFHVTDYSNLQLIPRSQDLYITFVDNQTGQTQYWHIVPSYHAVKIDDLPETQFDDYSLTVGDYEIYAHVLTKEYARPIARHKGSKVEQELDVLLLNWSANSTTTYRQMVLFAGGDNINGYELWRTTGTAEGTFLVADIRHNDTAVGTPAAGRSSFPADFMLFKDQVIFTASAPDSAARNLWITQGSTTTTKQLTRFPNNNTPATQAIARGTDGQAAILAGEKNLFFFTSDSENGLGWNGQLWVSDGTVAGTMWLKDFASNNAEGWSEIPAAVIVEDHLYFIVPIPNTDNQYELWLSDGTVIGTKLITPLESATPVLLTASTDHVYLALNQNDQALLYYYQLEKNKLRNLTGLILEPIHQLIALDEKIFFVNRDESSGKLALVYLNNIVHEGFRNYQFRYPQD